MYIYITYIYILNIYIYILNFENIQKVFEKN